MIDRARKPRDLKIDFVSLEKRKQHEYAKLEKMIQYSRSRQCRRSYILNYFGECATRSVHCGGCDNCRPDQGLTFSGSALIRDALPIDTPQGQEVILKVLSGVARAKGRFGKIAVAQMLTGSDSERMSRWKLDQLSTYGILRDCGFTQKDVTDIIDALARARLVETQDVDRFKPVVTLTEAGWSWLKNRDGAEMILDLPDSLLQRIRCGGTTRPVREPALDRAPSPPMPSSSGFSTPSLAPELLSGEAGEGALSDDPLRDRLRSLRADWARELKQPPYCIFTNETLEALVRQRPSTPTALASIKGLGRARVERHGAALLQAIETCPRGVDAVAEPQGSSAPQEAPPPRPSSPHLTSTGHVPTEEWTYRLIDRGFTIADAAAIRGLEPAAIVRHLTWMVRRGYSVPVHLLLPPETVASWEAWRNANGDASPPLEPSDSLHLWPLFLASRAHGPLD